MQRLGIEAMYRTQGASRGLLLLHWSQGGDDCTRLLRCWLPISLAESRVTQTVQVPFSHCEALRTEFFLDILERL